MFQQFVTTICYNKKIKKFWNVTNREEKILLLFFSVNLQRCNVIEKISKEKREAFLDFNLEKKKKKF